VTSLQILKSVLLVALITSFVQIPSLSSFVLPSILFALLVLRLAMFITLIYHLFYW
jgi:hypothetical protein